MTELNKSSYTKNLQLAQIFVFNAIPLLGVLYLGWSAKLLILAYFIETIIAILFHAVRLWYVNFRWGNEPETNERAAELAKANKGQNMPASWLPFFMLSVFGFFCFVQLYILGGFANQAFPEGIFTSMYRAATGELAWVVLSFVFLQLSRFFMEVIRGEYRNTPSEALFFQPFRRILTQQLTVILGGFIILLAGANSYVFVLVLVTIAIDLFFFFIGNKKLKAMITKNDPEKEKQYEELKKMM
ncbi:MAG: DUF6498-containing protein [Saprospiraceae bacterium]|nr:DUF6498-containing protein [Saprospiraceae bacterium]MCF8250906.1 DUF6498-containing protein [Saprospiraceae bacterium]MCF8282707.1 DUF6498-containing protein [Bacteroidales bacterium]MCF8311871.1 DUF6498-containing protein [Saprospiraceae bacterium]MCF8443015.1 DUF6498-containing protein [Saprospiraceae bacterium]